MRLVSYDNGNGSAAGVLIADEIVPLGAAAEAADIPLEVATVRGALAGLDAEELGRLSEAAGSVGERIGLADVRLLAPVTDPEKIICLGLNYRDHAKEAEKEIPEAPMWFGKFVNSLIGDGEAIRLPSVHGDLVDYEAEVAVVMGREASGVSEEEALSYVAGAMPLNDVSARDLQIQNPLWTSGKAIDTFAPCGPALVLMDEIEDLQDMALRTRINGEVVQEGTTAQMIFGVAETVAWLSRTMTLVPGDIIATGTPAGIGALKGVFLRDGDTVEVEVEGLGTLTNPVVSA